MTGEYHGWDEDGKPTQEKLAELIKLPADHAIGFIITVGKATKGSWPKPGQLPLEEVLIENHF